MGFTYAVDHERKTVRATASGAVMLADVLRHLDDERRDGALSYAEVIDARAATIALTPADVRTVVDTLRALGAAHAIGPTAVVVDSDHAYGMMRMLGMMVDEICSIQAFRSAADAEQWLQGLTGTT